MVDYIEKIQYNGQEPQYIESDCFNGTWVIKDVTLGNNVVYTANTYNKYNISSHLPDDGFDYEVMVSLYASTGGAINNSIHNYIGSGNNRWFTCRINNYRTGVKGARSTCDTAIVPVKANDKYIGVYPSGENSNSCYFKIVAYKRIGKNKWSNNNNMSNIQTPDGQLLTFGGYSTQGRWIKYDKEIMNNVTVNSVSDGATTQQYVCDISSHLPNDGFDYEVFLSFQINTNTTNGGIGNLRLYIFGKHELWCASETNDAANNKTRWCNVRIPVKANDKRIYIRNTWASSPIYVWAHIHAYRRLPPNV